MGEECIFKVSFGVCLFSQETGLRVVRGLCKVIRNKRVEGNTKENKTNTNEHLSVRASDAAWTGHCVAR